MSLYTPIQKKLLDTLADGRRHSLQELATVIDLLTSKGTVHTHICNIRKKMQPFGESIICEMVKEDGTRKAYYRIVRYTSS